jgi:hypothetical protein
MFLVFVAQCDRDKTFLNLDSSSLFKSSKFVKMADTLPFTYRPMKKKGGTLAGIPRASGERNSPVGNGASSHNQVSLIYICIMPCDL